MVSVRRDDLATLLTYSVRYALGRRTAAPSDVADKVRAYLGHLRTDELQRILDDIRDQERLGYGDDGDHVTWLGLAAQLEERLG